MLPKLNVNLKWLILLTIVLFVFVLIQDKYYEFTSKRRQLHAHWAHVEHVYQARFGLARDIDYLVKSTEGADSGIVQRMDRAHLQWRSTEEQFQKMAAVNAFETALVHARNDVSTYETLLGTGGLLELDEKLTATADAVSDARSRYNDHVRRYNLYLSVFPQNIFNIVFRFEPAALFSGPSR